MPSPRRSLPVAAAFAFACRAAPLLAQSPPAQSPAAQTVLASASVGDSVVARRAAPSDSQPPTAAKKAPPPPPFLGIKLSGYIESGYTRSNRPNGETIAGRMFDHANNQLGLNAVKLTFDRSAASATWDIGAHADFVVGQNAHLVQSTGFNLGANGDVYQLFATLNVPTPDGHGVQLKVGRMATFLGVEAIETPVNPNLSVANQFVFAENVTQTGVSVEHRFSALLDAQVRVSNGWDQVRDVNSALSYMARIGITPSDRLSIAVSGYTGAEEPNDNVAQRSGAQLIVTRKLGRVTAALQGDVGREQRNDALADPTRSAVWNAAGAWVTFDATPALGIALRGDWFDDRDGFRTGAMYGLSGGADHRLSSATATVNFRGLRNLLLRPEVRIDHSNQHVFRGTQTQVTLGFGAAVIF